MAKYIIEIDDEPFGRNDDPMYPHGMDELYKATNFNSLVFDSVGLSKLTPYTACFTEEDVYRRCEDAKEFGRHIGQEEGWNAAVYMADAHGLPKDFFNKFDLYSVVEEMKKYETKYSVGDEIEWKDDSEVFRGILLDQLDFDGNWYMITENGCVERIHETQFHKTGKKYTTVIDMVKELGVH